MKYYIAYGSNLNIEQMAYRCPDAKPIGTTVMKNWQLLFKGSKTGSYLTIERTRGSQVPVAVWAVSDRDEKNLDRYEGFPNFYYKMPLTLKRKGKLLDAFVYIMHENRKIGIPTQHYIDTCLEGYEDFGFDRAFIDEAVAFSYEKVGVEDRLTTWNGKKWVLPQGRTSDGHSYWRIIAERLAEYENTGLTPEAIERLKKEVKA